MNATEKKENGELKDKTKPEAKVEDKKENEKKTESTHGEGDSCCGGCGG